MLKFNVFFVLLSTYLCSGSKKIDVDTKILGGDTAPDGTIKYQVSLQNVGSHFCGASIIDPKWVLTAAHCTENRPAKSFKVVVGINSLSSKGQQYTPDKVIIHPDYDTKLIVNDLSLVRIPEGIEMNSRVQPIALPKTNTKAGDTVTVTGWGRTSNDGPIPDKLQIINETAIAVKECRIKYKTAKPPIRSTHLCLRAPSHEGSCQGDSGGPLAQDNAIVGLVSWGPEACGHSKRTPDVNTRVYSYVDWIKETMEKNN